MKKIFAAACALLAALAFVSCSAKKNVDTFGWYSDFSEAKKAAQKDNKSLILYFSALDSDSKSANFNDKIFKTAEFKEKFSPEYVFCNIDFSNSRFDDVYLNGENPSDDFSDEKNDEENSKKSERSAKESSRLQEELSRDMLLPSYYAVETFPAVFILTKQGYVISPLLIEENYDIDDFSAEIAKANERKNQISNLLATIYSGKKDDALNAINELYDTTEDPYKFLLEDLHEKYISLDKNNKSGGTVEHIFELANARAQKAFFENDYEKALQELESPLKYKILSSENRLQAYYSTGYFLAMSGSTNYERIIDYFQKAYDSAPESEYAPAILQTIENLKNYSLEDSALENESKAADSE